MADWPELDEIKQVLDVTSSDWDGDEDESRLTALRLAAIDKVKADVGLWDEDVDEPSVRLNRAALRMAELLAEKPGVAQETVTDPVYRKLLSGYRRRFGVA